MNFSTVILLHGFPSSGNSSKARYFQERFEGVQRAEFHSFDFNPSPRDFEYLTITGMINRLRQYILDHNLTNVRIIGSSMGALVGIHYSAWFGEVERMLLLAPSLSYAEFEEEKRQDWEEEGIMQVVHFGFDLVLPLRYAMNVDGFQYQNPIAPSVPTMIVHGKRDDVVPIESSRAYTAAYPQVVELVEVDSNHRLKDQMDKIWEYVVSFLLR